MTAKYWYEKQLRVLQTVLREPDIVDYNAREVVQYMENIHANCLIINAGGIVDFFHHDLPTANPNPFMRQDQDILKDITEACHAKGIKVIVRVDFRGVEKRLYELHPDWFSIDEDGKPMLYDTNTVPHPLYRCCYAGYYRNEYAYRYMTMLMERYDLDGIWENSYHEKGACYCSVCTAEYRKQFGEEIPRGGHFYEPKYDNYRKFKEAYYKKHLADSQATVKQFGEDKIFCSEAFGLYYESYRQNSASLYNIKDNFDFLVTPMFIGNHQALNGPSSLIKFLKSITLDKTPMMLYGHLGTNNELRYVSSAPAEARIWMWQTVGSGGSLWNTIFVGQHPNKTYDRRNAFIMQDVYGYMKQHEDKLHNQKPVADVSIFYSIKTSQQFTESDFEKDRYVTHLIGLEQALLDRKIQYNFVNDRELTSDALKGVKVLLVPNAACLSDGEIEILRRYVQDGGKLLATNQTSMFHPDGTDRGNYALRDVFGCSYTGITKDCSHYGYQYIRNADHPIVKGMEDTEMLANWGPNMLVRPDREAGVEMPVSYVPQIFPQSPERAWLRSLETDYPTVVVNRYGNGISVFFPYGIDRQIVVHGHQDFKQLLGNAVQYLLDGQYVTSDAPSSMQFILNQSTDNSKVYLLHAINMTSAPSRPVARIIPLPTIRAQIVLDGQYGGCQILYGDAGIAVERTESLADNRTRLHLLIPVIHEYMGLAIEMK